MSVIGGVLLYTAGLVTGAGAIILHQREVRRAVTAVRQQKNTEIAKLRTAYERLQEDAGVMQQASDCADAYRKGRSDGRLHPMSDAERFAHTLEGRRVHYVDTTKQG